MTLVKIADAIRPCMNPEHNPPSMIVLSPGTYEHTCPGCGQKTIFSVRGVYIAMTPTDQPTKQEEPTMNVNEIARVCHEVNRAYCLALGDTSQPAWEDAPEWQRSSAINGVQMHIDNPTLGPEASHEGWMREKVEAGWVYGPVKDPAKKEHPCIVPFDRLPREQQAKDYIFRAIVHELSR